MNYLNLQLYSYNIKENNTKLLNISRYNKYYISQDDENRQFTQNNKELSCEYMAKYNPNSNKYSNIFICFFSNTDVISTTNYYISNNNFIHTNSISSVFSKYMNNRDYGQTFIKSETNYNRTLAFIWFHFAGNNRTYFTTLNISSNTMEIPRRIDNCSNEFYKTKINKFPKSNELAITYEINNKEIKADLYNNIDIKYNKSSFKLNVSCENITGPAISYYNNNQSYYIYYCFKNYSDEIYKNDSEEIYKNDTEEIYKNDSDTHEENKNPNLPETNRNQSSNRIIIYIIIAAIVLILLAISVFLYIKFCRKTEEQKLANKLQKTKKDEKAINDIISNLIPDNN